MTTQLDPNDRFRITADYKRNNFIDIEYIGYESIALDMYPNIHYIELRKKENYLRLFLFPKKSYKKEYDFNWWDDAEVVFSLNNINKNENNNPNN